MPFIRVKITGTGRKYDVNVAHIMAFTPDAQDPKETIIELSTGEEMNVQESAQAVRGAIRRAEQGTKAVDAEPATQVTGL